MNRWTVSLIIVVVIAVAVVAGVVLWTGEGRRWIGDSGEGDVPQGPPIEEVYDHVRPEIEPFEHAVKQGAQSLPAGRKGRMVEALASVMDIYKGTENGRRAMARIADEVRQLIRDARDADNWELVDQGTDIFGVFRRDELFMSFYSDLAEVRLNVPKVKLHGFFEDQEKDQTYAFVEVRIHGSNEVRRLQVRPGEEFLEAPYTLRFDEIIGKNRGIRLEYLAIPGYYFKVMKEPVPGRNRP